MVPKLSAPLSKLIRTGEGIILFAFNVSSALAVVVNDASPATALKYAAIFNAVAFASRTFLKAVAVGKPIVGGDPIAPPAAVTGPVDAVLAEIDAAARAAGVIQTKPGTPAEQVTAGLAPTTPPVQSAAPFAQGAITKTGGAA